MGIPTVEIIFTPFSHAGGKFGQGGYSSGGLQLGSSVVNALSSWLEVEISLVMVLFT